MVKPTNAELEGDIITGACSPWDKRHNAAMQELIDARERLARLEAALVEAHRLFYQLADADSLGEYALRTMCATGRDKTGEALSPSEAGGGGT